MRKRKFIDALICVTKRYGVVIEVPDPPEIRRERGKKPVPSYEVLVDDTRKQFMALGTSITEAPRKECPANPTEITPEARHNAIVRMCLFFGCNLVFDGGLSSGNPIHCVLIDGSDPNLVLFSIECKTLTDALDGVADAIANKNLGVEKIDIYKIMMGEIKIR